MKSRSFHAWVHAHRSQAGFTLVELMVTVAIVAILASIAVPAYRAYIVRANRGAAKACMSEYAQFMERYYTTNMTYVGASGTLGCASDANLNIAYSFTINAPTARTYTVTATPVNAQLSRDTQCGTLTLSDSGAKTPTTSGCW